MTGANSPWSSAPTPRGRAPSCPTSAGMPSALAMAVLNCSIMDPAFSTVTCTSMSGLACLAAWSTSGKT